MRSANFAIEWLESRSMTDANFGALMFMAGPFNPTDGSTDQNLGAEVAPVQSEVYSETGVNMLQLGAGERSSVGGAAFIDSNGAAADAAFMAGAASD